MRLDLNSRAFQLAEPQIAERRLRIDDMLAAVFESGSPTGHDGWAIRQVVNRIDITAERQGGVVKQRGAVCFFNALQSIDEMSKQFGLLCITIFRNDFASAIAVVAHVMRGDRRAHAADK